MKNHSVHFFIGMLLVFQSPAPIFANISQIERNALITLYNSTDGDNWKSNSRWKEPPLHVDGFAKPGTEGNWRGVTVEMNTVVEIEIVSNNLSGTLPKEVGNLTNLKELILYNNRLTGNIPIEIGNLSHLEKLYLRDNPFSATIPSELGKLSNLTMLYLSSCQLKGKIPAELGNLSKLTNLSLVDNQLTGEIPKELGKLSKLEDFHLAKNVLTGAIPGELGSLSRITWFSLAKNRLHGSIPKELGHLGSIPEELGHLPGRMKLDLSNNQLSGEIPPELGKMPKLIYLCLNDNKLAGSIPPELGDLPYLTALNLSNNQLTGSIPPELGQLKYLWHLHLSRNSLSGSIPEALGHLSDLKSLNLSNNQLSGNIPASLGNLQKLNSLDISNNHLNGHIPIALGNMTNLRAINLSNNDLTGDIPTGFGKLIHLYRLDIKGNKLTGSVPDHLKEGFLSQEASTPEVDSSVANTRTASFVLPPPITEHPIDPNEPVPPQLVRTDAPPHLTELWPASGDYDPYGGNSPFSVVYKGKWLNLFQVKGGLLAARYPFIGLTVNDNLHELPPLPIVYPNIPETYWKIEAIEGEWPNELSVELDIFRRGTWPSKFRTTYRWNGNNWVVIKKPRMIHFTRHLKWAGERELEVKYDSEQPFSMAWLNGHDDPLPSFAEPAPGCDSRYIFLDQSIVFGKETFVIGRTCPQYEFGSDFFPPGSLQGTAMPPLPYNSSEIIPISKNSWYAADSCADDEVCLSHFDGNKWSRIEAPQRLPLKSISVTRNETIWMVTGVDATAVGTVGLFPIDGHLPPRPLGELRRRRQHGSWQRLRLPDNPVTLSGWEYLRFVPSQVVAQEPGDVWVSGYWYFVRKPSPRRLEMKKVGGLLHLDD